MKRAFVVLLAFAAWLLSAACDPDQPEATLACTALHDCAFGQLCDLRAKVCIPEPDNRLVGSLTCNLIAVSADPILLDQAAEASGLVNGAQFSFNDPLCLAFDLDNDPSTPQLLVADVYPSTNRKVALELRVEFPDLAAGPVTVVPHTEAGHNSFQLTDDLVARRYASAVSGTIRLVKGKMEVGQLITLEFDINVIPATSADPRYGRPCPLGIAQCGQLLTNLGGVEQCSKALKTDTNPVCIRSCTTDGDCVVGGGKCVGGYCALSCVLDSDCDPGNRCVNLVPNGPKGCL